jgi:phage baseplate assembly protein W
MTTRYMYSDVDIIFDKQTDGDVLRDTGIDAVKNSLSNIISTMPGSRRMLPTFVGYFHNLLFEPIDEITARELGYSLVDAIRMWDDRVIIDNVHVIASPDNNMYKCTLIFRVRESNEPEEIKFILVQK